MDIQKLFRVLVVGGASLASGCSTPSQPTSTGSAGDDDVPDRVATAAEPMADEPGAPAEDETCFCNDDADCCDGDEVREGFTCCWSTSC